MVDTEFGKGISRRGLMKGGAAVAGALALGFPAKEAGAQETLPKKWDRTDDVVVIGSGGAGLSAAVTAADKGAGVVVLEKMPIIGGNTVISGGYLNAADPERQGKQGIQDSPENHFKQTLDAGDYRADPEKVRILTENALDALHWLESMGMKFDNKVTQIFGAIYPRCHMPVEPRGQGYIRTLKAAADKRGIKILTEMRVSRIIRDPKPGGRVLGVEVVDRKNKRIFYRARKAVIIAAGGFSANKELRSLHDPRMKDLTTTNHSGATGDMILAAMDIGAYPIGMDYIQCSWGPPPGRDARVTLQGNVDGFIMVDKRAKRFVAEDERRDVIRDAILNLPERFGYILMDDKGRLPYERLGKEQLEAWLKGGDAWKADTLEEMASKMGVPVEEFVATVKKYNDIIVANRKDPEFGRNSRNLTKRIETPPFWGYYAGMSVHHTMGGLNINGKTQVFDRQRKLIPGLYAAGEGTGGIHGSNRVGGNAVAGMIVFGRIAGANAASEA